MTPGYTGKRRVGGPRELVVGKIPLPPPACPELPCPQCGGSAAVEPALTVTRDGVATTSWPVTCKAGCTETYTKGSKERTRPLRSYVPTDLAEPSSRPIDHIRKEETEVKNLTPEDHALIERVKEMKERLEMGWPAIAKEMGKSYSGLANVIRNPKMYLSPGMRDTLTAWVDKPRLLDPEPIPEPVSVESAPETDLWNGCDEEPDYDQVAAAMEDEFDTDRFDPQPYPEAPKPCPIPDGKVDLDIEAGKVTGSRVYPKPVESPEPEEPARPEPEQPIAYDPLEDLAHLKNLLAEAYQGNARWRLKYFRVSEALSRTLEYIAEHSLNQDLQKLGIDGLVKIKAGVSITAVLEEVPCEV